MDPLVVHNDNVHILHYSTVLCAIITHYSRTMTTKPYLHLQLVCGTAVIYWNIGLIFSPQFALLQKPMAYTLHVCTQ